MPTLPSYYRECGYALDDLGLYTLASSTTSTMVIAALVNATANASTLAYDDRSVYVPSVPEQVRVRPGGYAPSTGTLTHYPASSNPGAVAVVLTSLFPIKGGILGESTSYLSLINQALSLIDRHDVLSVSVTTSADHALSTWAAWITEDRVSVLPDTLDVREPSPVSGFPAIANPARRWEYVDDVDTPKIRTRVPFASASGSLEVRVRRPSDTWIRVSSTWAESTAGLVNESDEALPRVNHVVRVFLPLAYRALMNRQPGAPSDPTLMKKFADAWADAQDVPGFNGVRARQLMPEADQMQRAA